MTSEEGSTIQRVEIQFLFLEAPMAGFCLFNGELEDANY
jgi:hypothetical protein